MAKNILADLVLRLSANSAELEKGLKQANTSLNGLNKNTQNIGGQIIGSFAKIGAAVGAAAGAFKFLKSSIESVEGPGDKLAATIAGAKGAIFELQRGIATMDFRNLITNMIEGYKAGKKFEEAMDALGVTSAYTGLQVARLERQSADLANQIADTSDITQKSALADQRLKIEQEIARLLKKQSDDEFNTLKEGWKAKNKLTAEQALKSYEIVQGLNEQQTKDLDLTWSYITKILSQSGSKALETFDQIAKTKGAKGFGVSEEQLQSYRDMISLEGRESENLVKLFELWKNRDEQIAKADQGLKNATKQNESLLNKQDKASEKLVKDKEKVLSIEEETLKILQEQQIANLRSVNNPTALSPKGPPTFAGSITVPDLVTPVMNAIPAVQTYSSAWTALTVNIQDAFATMSEGAVNVGDMLTMSLLPAVDALTNAFGNLFAGTSAGFKDVVTVALQSIGQIINALFAKAIAGMISGESQKGLLGLATAAIGVGVLTALWKTKVPAFAAGGIVSGPTVGLMGEYAGAANNPEVIAPLSKLQDMLGEVGTGEVRFVIEQNQLVGILSGYNKKNIYF